MATVGGLHQKSYGASPIASSAGYRTASTDPTTESYGGYEGSAGCAQCSERERGYKWAVLATVRYPEQCPGDSWDFRRGCLDFVGGS